MEGHRPSQSQTGTILPLSASRQGTTYGSTSNTGTPQAQVATALLTGGGRVAMMVDGSGQNRPLHRTASPNSAATNSSTTPTAVYGEEAAPATATAMPTSATAPAAIATAAATEVPSNDSSPRSPTLRARAPTSSSSSNPPVPPTDSSAPKRHTSPDGTMNTKEDCLPAFLAHLPPGTPLGSGASRWSKLRTTVQISGAMSANQKKAPLKREDSFLQRFSTRHIGEAQDADGNPVTEGEPIPKPRLWSRSTCRQLMFGVINPDENALFLWLWLLTICVLYNAWALILRQTFTEIQHLSVFMWIAFDGFSDFVYLLDIVIQFRTGYLEQGLMVSEGSKLRGHYLRSRSFLLDLVALTPLDLLQFIIGVTPLLRFPRFIKVYRCYRFYYMVESRTIYPNFWRVANLIHILLLLSHWFGCFHYMLSEFENFRGAWAYTNPYKSDNAEWRAITRKYVASVYWSTLTLTTIGGDHVTPSSNLQYAFTILSYLIGVFIFATIVGQVGNVITNRNASRLEFERLLDGAKLYMRHHKVPHQMQRRVQRWYDYSWSRGRMRGGGDINSALGGLPDKLKTELALHVNLKTLKKVSIFQECQPEFLHDLVLKMRAYIFTPGDLICRKGEVAREMFIIADGILEVISETGKVLTQMKPGDFFGEIGILNLDGFNRRTADVRSVGYSELFSLSREDVLSAMRDYPEAQEILRAMGRKRLMDAGLSSTMNCPMQTNTPLKQQQQLQQQQQFFQQEADVQSQPTAVGPMITSVGQAPTAEPEVEDTASLPESQKSPKSPVRSPVGTAPVALSTQKSMNTIRKFRKDLKHLLRSGTLASNGSCTTVAGLCAADVRFVRSAPVRPGALVNKSISRLLRRFHVGHRQTSSGEPVLQSSRGQTIGGIEGDVDTEVQDNLSLSSIGPGRSESKSAVQADVKQRRSPSASSASIATESGPASTVPLSSAQTSTAAPSQAQGARFNPSQCLQHCNPTTGRSPRSELLTVSPQLEARRHSEAPPTSKRFFNQGGIAGTGGVGGGALDTGTHPRQRITDSLRRATMVSTTFEPPLASASMASAAGSAMDPEIPLLRRVLMLKREQATRANEERLRQTSSRPESLQLSESSPRGPASGSRLAKLSPRVETDDEVFISPPKATSPRTEAPEGKWSPTFPKDVPIIGSNKEVDEGPAVGSSAAETTDEGLNSPDEGHAGDGEVASNINHNNSINVSSNNNNITTSFNSSNIINNNNNNNNNASTIVLEDDALTRQSKPDIDDANQSQQTFIITDQENVELMVTAAMKQIKIAVTDYLKDTHMELTSRVEALEHELEIKDNLIIELQDELIFKEKEFRHQKLGPNFIEDICSLSETSFESDDEESAFLLAATVPSSDVFDPSPRNSWPRSGFETSTFSELHANNGIHNHEESRIAELCNSAGDRSASWHDYLSPATSAAEHAGMVAASKMGPDDLWKLEFPQISDNVLEGAGRSIPVHDHSASIEKKIGSEKPGKRGSKDTALTIKQAAQTHSNNASQEHAPPLKVEDARQPSCDDWEVKMLVEQFDEKMKRRSLEGRRHSSCDIQSWERLVLQTDPSSSYPTFGGTSRDPRDSREMRRRYGRCPRALFTRGRFPDSGTTSRRAEIRRASLARFASVDVPTLQARRRILPSDSQCSSVSSASPCVESVLSRSDQNLRLREISSPSSQTISSQDSRVAAFRRKAFCQSRYSSMAEQSPTSSCSRGRSSQQWKSLDDEAPRGRASPSMVDAELESESEHCSTEAIEENLEEDVEMHDNRREDQPGVSSQDDATWSPTGQTMGLPTIKEGLRLQGQKSELSDEDEDDSNSTKTTLFIDMDEEYSDSAFAKDAIASPASSDHARPDKTSNIDGNFVSIHIPSVMDGKPSPSSSSSSSSS